MSHTADQTRLGLVSVIIPTCDRAELLGRCVRSVLLQTHADLEVIIVNDASQDSTSSMIRHLASEDGRIRYTNLDTRSGPQIARNTAIRMANGRFVTNIDDDDEMLPDRIATLLSNFQQSLSLVCSGYFRKTFGEIKKINCTRELITLDRQLAKNRVGNSMLTLKERVIAVGLFDESLPAWQDYDLWTRLITNFGPGLRISEPSYVVHWDHQKPRVSRNASKGAELFLAKHSTKMQPRHIKRQKLEAFMIQEKKMTVADFMAHLSPVNFPDVFRYFVTSNFPHLRNLRRD